MPDLLLMSPHVIFIHLASPLFFFDLLLDCPDLLVFVQFLLLLRKVYLIPELTLLLEMDLLLFFSEFCFKLYELTFYLFLSEPTYLFNSSKSMLCLVDIIDFLQVEWLADGMISFTLVSSSKGSSSLSKIATDWGLIIEINTFVLSPFISSSCFHLGQVYFLRARRLEIIDMWVLRHDECHLFSNFNASSKHGVLLQLLLQCQLP